MIILIIEGTTASLFGSKETQTIMGQTVPLLVDWPFKKLRKVRTL